MNEKILIKVSGPDKPGITHELLSVIEKSNCQVCDMGQSVTHGLLSLSIFIELAGVDKEYPVVKDLLFTAKKLGMDLDFKIYEKNETPTQDKSERFILNCVSAGTIPTGFEDVSGSLSKNNVNILRLDTTNPNRFSSLEITTTIPKDLSIDKLKSELLEISNRHYVDAAFLKRQYLAKK